MSNSPIGSFLSLTASATPAAVLHSKFVIAGAVLAVVEKGLASSRVGVGHIFGSSGRRNSTR